MSTLRGVRGVCVCASLMPCVVVCVPHQRERKNNNSFDNVYEFIELGPPSATGVKRAESVLAGTFDFDGEIGSVEDGGASPLHHALWACSMSLAAKYVGWGAVWEVVCLGVAVGF